MTVPQFCLWLSQTPISGWMQHASWVVPILQSVHILAVAVVMSAILMLDLRLLGIVRGEAGVATLEQRFLPSVWLALLVLLASGLLLTICEPKRELLSTVFRVKMLLVTIAAGLTFFFQQRKMNSVQHGHARTIRLMETRLVAAVSLILWISIVTAGRWIAYTVDT